MLTRSAVPAHWLVCDLVATKLLVGTVLESRIVDGEYYQHYRTFFYPPACTQPAVPLPPPGLSIPVQYVVRSIDSTPVVITPRSCIRHDSLDVKSRPFRTLCRSAAALSKRALSQSSDRSRSAVFQSPSPSPSPCHHEWHHLSPQGVGNGIIIAADLILMLGCDTHPMISPSPNVASKGELMLSAR